MKVKKRRLREAVTHPKSKSQRELELGPKSIDTKFDAFFKKQYLKSWFMQTKVPGSLSVSHYLLFTSCEWKSMANDSLIKNKNLEGLKEEKKKKRERESITCNLVGLSEKHREWLLSRADIAFCQNYTGQEKILQLLASRTPIKRKLGKIVVRTIGI